jgi:uridine kinase
MYIIAVAGPSCAGKSELARHLAGTLSAPILSTDSYYRDLGNLSLEQRHKVNFDHPDAIEHELLTQHLEELAHESPVDVPVYDFTTHSRLSGTERLEPGRFLLLEGLFALYWQEARRLMRTKVFIDAPDTVCLARRQLRDVHTRGRTAESVLAQFMTTVQPMAERYVRPTRVYADLSLSGEEPVERLAKAVQTHVKMTLGPSCTAI